MSFKSWLAKTRPEGSNSRGPRLSTPAIIVLVIASFAIGFWLRGPTPVTDPNSAVEGSRSPMGSSDQPGPVEASAGQTNLVYVCPMGCVPPMEKPGNCPICGMELIEHRTTQDHGESDHVRLKLSPREIETASIRVAPVERRAVTAEIRLFGQIDYDPAHITKITAFMPGVIDRVYVKRAGQFVRWGDPLFDIYSSDLLETQQELVSLMQYVPSFLAFQKGLAHVAREAPISARAQGKTGEDAAKVHEAYQKMAAIRHKLSILGLPKRDIDELMKKGETTGIATVYASMYGQVIEQNAYEGTFVNTGAPVFVLADPEYVWANLEAYEADYPWLRKGQEVIFQTDAYPGERFHARLVYIDPVFNTETRTFSVGALFPDEGGRLKAGMLIRATIETPMSGKGWIAGADADSKGQLPLVIPDTAPLITGKRAVVYVADPEQPGTFEGREIMLGPKARDCYIVKDGLEEGELVVVNGNFKIDSAIQILAKSSMMSLPEGEAVTSFQAIGGSEAMNDYYRHERMESRTGPRSELEPSDAGSTESTREKVLAEMQKRRRNRAAIQRRKPGQYGSTVKRPAAPLRP